MVVNIWLKSMDLRAGFFKDDLIERSTILDFVHFLRSNPQIYEKFEYETIFPNYN